MPKQKNLAKITPENKKKKQLSDDAKARMTQRLSGTGAIEKLVKKTKKTAAASLSANTIRLYDLDWARFQFFCETTKVPHLPAEPEVLAAFLTHEKEEGAGASTLTRRLSAVHYFHMAEGVDSPRDSFLVQQVMAGARRMSRHRPPKPKAPAISEDLKAMVDCIDLKSVAGLRDRAILLVGFAGAFRRSELAAISVGELEFVKDGLLITIPYSKTDQEGKGELVGIMRSERSPYCPVDALSAWLDRAGIDAGAVFRRFFKGGKMGDAAISDKHVARTVKRYAALAGFDPAEYAGHSLRRGFITSAAQNEANLFKIAAQSRHKSLEMVRRYVDGRDKFKDHAGSGLL